MYFKSIWGSFSCQIQWWGQYTHQLVRSLHKSADMEEDLPITWQPVEGFQHMRGQFGVVFHAQSIGEVSIHISWHWWRLPHNLAARTSSVQNEINGLTLHLPKLDAILSLVVRNLAQLVLLYSGPASIFPKPARTSLVHNEINGLTQTWCHAEFGGAQPCATSTFV